MYLSKVSCISCKTIVSNKQITNHHNSKTCISTRCGTNSSSGCRFCGLDFSSFSGNKANHVKWCTKNPNHQKYLDNLSKIRNTNNSNPETRNKASKSISKAHKEGRYKNYQVKAIQTKIKRGNLKHSKETKQILRDKALSNHYQRKCKKSHIYIDKLNRTFIFDSSWEDVVADKLDLLGFYWERPVYPIHWIDSENKTRRYFPDFYIPSLDLYIDPKNTYAISQQKEKIDYFSSRIKLYIIDTKEKCLNLTKEQLAEAAGLEPASIQLR